MCHKGKEEVGRRDQNSILSQATTRVLYISRVICDNEDDLYHTGNLLIRQKIHEKACSSSKNNVESISKKLRNNVEKLGKSVF